MDQEIYDLHIAAGRASGQNSTCGRKQAYETEEDAARAAVHHNQWKGRHHDVEPYPCAFCEKWHLGRVMPIEVLRKFVGETPEDEG